jgi:hypothetical protein
MACEIPPSAIELPYQHEQEEKHHAATSREAKNDDGHELVIAIRFELVRGQRYECERTCIPPQPRQGDASHNEQFARIELQWRGCIACEDDTAYWEVNIAALA